MVTVRNISDKPILVSGKLLWPGETRQVHPAQANQPGLKVVGQPEPTPKPNKRKGKKQ